jgi:hypothetical protein
VCVLLVAQLFISLQYISWVILCMLIVVQLFVSSQYISWVMLCVLIVVQLFISLQYISWVILCVLIVILLVVSCITKTYALSYQNKRKRQVIKCMWPYGRKQTLTPTQVMTPTCNPHINEWTYISFLRSSVVINNTTPVHRLPS